MEYVEIGPDGAEELSDFAGKIMEEYFTTFLPEDLVKKVYERFLLPTKIREEIRDGFQFMYILKDGERIGYFAIQPNEKEVLLSKIYIIKEFRGHGYGTEALNHIKGICHEMGFDKIYLYVNRNNTSSIAMYKNNGFKITKSVDTDIGNDLKMCDYVMECRI